LNKQKQKLRSKDDDMNADEAAEKELSGMAKSSIKEEKDEMAANKSELDIKVDEGTLSTAAPQDASSSNAFSTPIEEVNFGITNPVDSKPTDSSEQDKMLEHQKEIEDLA
jgi:hypothetical protein